jgi:hypothetical protein
MLNLYADEIESDWQVALWMIADWQVALWMIADQAVAEVDALRAERDTQRIRADLSVELHRQAIEEIADRTAELAMLEAERDAAAPILEAAEAWAAARRAHESSPSRTGRYKAASDRLAALFHDDQPAECGAFIEDYGGCELQRGHDGDHAGAPPDDLPAPEGP